VIVGATDPDATNGASDPLSFDAIGGYTTPSVTLTPGSIVPGGATPCTGATITQTPANNATGTFDFDPPPGVTGSCTLNYKVTDGGFPAPGVSSANATITITINGPVIWFVDLGAVSNGDGRLSSPFNSLASANTAIGANAKTLIFVPQANLGVF